MLPASMAQTFFKVLAPQDALKILLGVAPVGEEQLASVKARGRVLAEDLQSAVDLPHFHRAAMDGYAVRAKDTFGASQSLPAYLKLAGVVEMGKEAAQALAPGSAMRISTGGMMPPEADAVVMVEYTDETDGGLVEIHRGVSPWQNVIQIGDDIKKGEAVFSRGRRLRAHDLGALTGVGISSIAVYQKPRVALISTGDEIVDADTDAAAGTGAQHQSTFPRGTDRRVRRRVERLGSRSRRSQRADRSDRRGARMGRCRAAFRRQLHGRERYRLGNDLIFS